MLNTLVKIVFQKELILYNPHRNSTPLVNNSANREKFVFLNPRILWKATGIVGRRTKLRYKLIYFILTILNPVYIIDINWVDKLQSVYLVWCRNHGRDFIVIQHGIYYAGMMRDIREKYVKCNILLVWGDYFKKMHQENNRGKDFRCISFGNPCYNIFDRSEFRYENQIGNRILIAVSLIKGERLRQLYILLNKLKAFGFDITVKEHIYQAERSEPITGYNKISGNLYPILKRQEYDIVVTDVSSVMTDIIFFKNRALYFSPDAAGSNLNENIYSDFLENLAYHIEDVHSREELLDFVDLEAQESLLRVLVKTENTSNDLNQLKNLENEDERKRFQEGKKKDLAEINNNVTRSIYS